MADREEVVAWLAANAGQYMTLDSVSRAGYNVTCLFLGWISGSTT